jgi:hypothetical protein
MGFPVLYVGDPFVPRRASQSRVARTDIRSGRLLLSESRVGPPALSAIRTLG